MTQLRSIFTQWTQVAGLLLMTGAVAWIIKLGVIVSTNGRIIDTGAAALLMKIGIVLLIVGSTGVGYYLTSKKNVFVRAIAILLSPILTFGVLVLAGMFITPFFKNSGIWYAEQEAPIAIAVIFYMTLGYVLYKRENGLKLSEKIPAK